MTTVATGQLRGHEARATMSLVAEAGGLRLRLRDLWVAPGAPDVRLYASPRPDGAIDEHAIDLGKVPDHTGELDRDLPPGVDPSQVTTVIIYCKVFSVLFGRGTLAPVPA